MREIRAPSLHGILDKWKRKSSRTINFFVFYLSSEGNEPAAQDWRHEKRDYYNDFQNRYFNLSYRYKVLPWLEKVEKDGP